ncbi:MAG: UDP-N-acetylmuramate--L-alanine ligase [Bacilli bacterium]|mgnify:CR=1 FL=1|nr:UDP-N-acetylmuramate--L-alanine ligase [Bacilli bacterium]MDD4608015.1 UDP-N-acetylmuramate--L-alanine ligase [Bacilli bacterium]
MKYYLIGIKGAGLSALALILNDLGYKVVGYDDEKSHQFTEDKLIEKGIKIYTEDNDEIDSDTIVIRSTAIKMEHPQVQKAVAKNLKIYEYNQMLGKLANMFDSITVAGCHGKTTTSSLMAHTLNNLVGCNYLIGDGTGSASKENKKFVLEACEYKRNFLVYEPEYAIITNIDLDHVDYYKDIADVVDAYQEYANNASKMVIACGDDPYTHSLEVNTPIFFYGLDADNDIIAKNVEYTSTGINFDVFVEDNYYGYFDLPFYGKHMLLNSLAVIGVCYYERLNAKDVQKNMKTFGGASRRFNELVIGDNVIIDDYAHHPSEVKVTIKAAKQKYPDKEIVAVFQPHTFSRTKQFSEDLTEVLNLADKSYILDVFPAREKQEDYPEVTKELILKDLENGEAIDDDTSSKLFNHKNAVIIFMSPKEIYKIKSDLEEYLNNNN